MQMYLEWQVNTAYRKVWWTHMEQLLGFIELDAQAVLPLSTGEGQKETGKRSTRERHSYKHALKLTNNECKHEQDINHHEHKYHGGYVDFVSTTCVNMCQVKSL